jgi:hypothetical protein
MKLIRRGDEYLILVNGAILMSNRMHGSEEALATFAFQWMRTLERPSILIGGLGMGFTLRATLDLLPSDAAVVVAELVPAVVEWNRGPLGPLAKHPLKDKRVRVETGDVAVTLSSRLGQFRCRAARRGQWPSRIDRLEQRRTLRQPWNSRRPCESKENRSSGYLGSQRGSKIQAAIARWRIRRASAAPPWSPNKWRSSPHYLSGSKTLN